MMFLYIDNWMILLLLLIISSPIFIVIYGIYHAIRYRRSYVLKISFISSGVILCGMYYIYCSYVDQQEIAYYCIDKQCISVVHFYKSPSINAPLYAKIYKGKVLFRFQAKIKSYAELLMEDDILISKKLLDNKFIVYGYLPATYGNIDTIEVRDYAVYRYGEDDNYIESRKLKFKKLY